MGAVVGGTAVAETRIGSTPQASAATEPPAATEARRKNPLRDTLPLSYSSVKRLPSSERRSFIFNSSIWWSEDPKIDSCQSRKSCDTYAAQAVQTLGLWYRWKTIVEDPDLLTFS